jgi:shikimate kinase
MNSSNIILVGFPGTGKSTVGKLIASRLGWRFMDTDLYIEAQQGQSISVMFAEQGEAFFRNLESQAIKEILSGKDQVVATGGGAVLAASNREQMLAGGFVVALTASAEVIIQRVSSDQSRPLLQGNLEEKVLTIMEQRKHAYDFAHELVDTSNLSSEDIAELILAKTRIPLE